MSFKRFTEISAEKKVNLGFIILLLVLLIALKIIIPDFYKNIFVLAANGDMEALVAYIRSFGSWAIPVAFVMDVVVNSLGFLPSIFLSTANGLIFGLPLGILISWVAECVGVIISFLLMRFLMQDVAQKIIHKSKRLEDIDAASGEEGLKFMALARMMPYFPSGILTAIGAVSSMSIRDYVIATFIGKFPSTALEVVVGHDLANLQEHTQRLGILTFILLAVYVGIYYRRRKQKQELAKVQAANINNKAITEQEDL